MRGKYLFFGFIITLFAFVETGVFQIDPPEHFPPIQNDLSKNKVTKEKVELGRKLFYDPILSKDGSVSCASCHSPYNAFAHTDHDLSHGINDAIGRRNAPALFNLAWHKSFNWDGAVNHLDMQALAPINDEREMGETTVHVIEKIKENLEYDSLFQLNFYDGVSMPNLLKALSQFQLTLISAGSKYDAVQLGTDTFTYKEENGYQLFLKHCNSCHQEPLFTNGNFANNGLPVDSTLMDYGRGGITLQGQDSLQFKVPTLRNLSYTYPYMHDGRFSKIRKVVEHYLSLSESPLFVSDTKLKTMTLTSNEKVDLISFLLTLDDPTFVMNKNHHFPR